MDSLWYVYDVQTARLVHLAPTVHVLELPIGSGGLRLAFLHFGTRCATLPLHVPSVVQNDHLSLRCHIVVSIEGGIVRRAVRCPRTLLQFLSTEFSTFPAENRHLGILEFF
jgi:hypothetical protein